MTSSHNVDSPLRSSNLTMFMDQEQDYSKFFGKLEKSDAGVWVKEDFITNLIITRLLFCCRVFGVCTSSKGITAFN